MNKKSLKLSTKIMLYIANNEEDYTQHLILSESAFTLLRHLFGRAYAIKQFVLLRNWKRDPRKQIPPLLTILNDIRRRLKKPIPKTPYQVQYQEIKKRVLKTMKNIDHTLRGIHGKPRELKRLRKLARRINWGDYFAYQTKRGERYHILSK